MKKKKNNYIAFPGSFDFIHEGHLFLIRNQIENYDKIFIIISNNPNKNHSPLFIRKIKIIVAILKNRIPFYKIKIIKNKGMTTDILKKYDINVILRGYRNIDDYIYENELYDKYLLLKPDLKRVLIESTTKYKDFRSSLNKN